MAVPESAPIRLLAVDDILKMIPITKQTFNEWERDGIFPRGRKLGGGITSKRFWVDTVVHRWIAENMETATQ